MLSRRTYLRTVGSVGAAFALAGCSQQESNDESNPADNGTPDDKVDDQTKDEELIADVRLDSIEFLYGVSSGLSVRPEIRYTAADGEQRFRTEVEAFAGDTSLASGSSWDTLGAGLTTEYEFVLDEISGLGDADLEDVTELVVRGRKEGAETVTLESYSGETVRDRVER